ncbi:hypothetical protein [Flavobacterium fluviatile]|uniref:hypothetical protein n=1 Tax=Flavobacterium fluviatile TaxID=1862387 RepID=UPI0013D7D2D6|nr:hypothetical protein [Flavobacterium fluviatile]
MKELLDNKDLIEIFAGIGTFLSALVALYTLFEVKKQRKSTYKPELFLDSFYFDLVTNPFFVKKEKMMHFKNRDKGEKANKKKKENKSHIYVKYKLENLGFGFGKLIECKWEFDYNKAIKELKKIAPEEIIWDKILEYTSIQRNDGFYDSFNYKDLEVQKIDFIAPHNINNEEKKETFPHSIIKIYVYYLIFKYELDVIEAKNFHHEEFKSLPQIKLKLSYKDLNGGIYRKTLKIKLNAFSYQIEDIMDCKKDICTFSVNVYE